MAYSLTPFVQVVERYPTRELSRTLGRLLVTAPPGLLRWLLTNSFYQINLKPFSSRAAGMNVTPACYTIPLSWVCRVSMCVFYYITVLA